MMAAERLQKLIAAAGIASRRAAERMIAEGRVTVDGQVIRVPGVRADPEASEIRVDGARLRALGRARRYLVLNKPIGYLTTRSDPARRPTVMELLPLSFRSLVPVGRLDGQSSGLLLMTDDGQLAERVAHPRYRVPKTYLATVRGLPEPAVLDRAQRGLRVDGESLRLDQVEWIAGFPHRAAAKRRSRLRVTLRGGRNREIRRVLSVLGHPVLELHRTQIGNLADTGLAPGRWRKLRAEEVAELRAVIRRSSGERDEAGVPAPAARPAPLSAPVSDALVVALDGSAGAGKSSVARAVAERFGLGWFNTGASVRAVALAAMRAGASLDDGPGLRAFAWRVILDPEGRVFLDGEDVSREVRAKAASRGASRIAVHPELREVLVARWRQAAVAGGVVEGRDIGTVVFPEAAVKVFLEARPEVRASRRSADEGDPDRRAVQSDLEGRDRTDAGREIAPLRRAEDAHRLDTSELSLDETVDRVAALLRKAGLREPA